MGEREQDDIDQLLLADDAVVPSPGFAAGVMSTIGAAADEPPLPFPWLHYAAGVLICVGWTACGIWLIESSDWSALDDAVAKLAPVGTELGYAAAAACGSIALLGMQRAIVAMRQLPRT
jgi:hypothetical protein